MTESNAGAPAAPAHNMAAMNAGTLPPSTNSASFRSAAPPASGYIPSAVVVPALPPRPEMLIPSQNYGLNQGYSYGGMGGMGSYGMAGMGSYGMNSMGPMVGIGGMGGYGGYGGGYGLGGMGMGMNNQLPYGHGNVESRFIQMAEENTRPAFESIQSLVYAVGGVSMMLENTFFALTSSFRAILGVAENFGRLRSLFAQFWTTFGMIRSINWLIRKLSVMIGLRTEAEFKAWAEAVAATQAGTATAAQRARGSSWPVLLFFGVIAAAPYILLKMMNGSTYSDETLSDPRTWKNPLRGVAQFPFQANSSQELSFNQNQVLKVAPEAIQGSLWTSGWLVATADGITPGLVPVNYLKIVLPDQPQPSKPAQPAASSPNQKLEETLPRDLPSI